MLSRLTKVRGWGGNYLVNVSPRPTGDMPDAYYQRLQEVKEWMKHSGESIFDVQPGPHPEQSNIPVTVRDKRWYLHVNGESQDLVVLTGVSEPGSVKLLRTGTELEHKLTNGQLIITIPSELRTDSVDVVSVDW